MRLALLPLWEMHRWGLWVMLVVQAKKVTLVVVVTSLAVSKLVWALFETGVEAS